MKPKVGSVVIFNDPVQIGEKYEIQKSPAIVQKIAADGSITLVVFGMSGIHSNAGALQGNQPYQWSWPEDDKKEKTEVKQ